MEAEIRDIILIHEVLSEPSSLWRTNKAYAIIAKWLEEAEEELRDENKK